MKKYINTLKNCMLFADMEQENIEKMLLCLNATVKKYEKDSTIILTGDEITSVGIVVAGVVLVIKEDYLGNSSILTALEEADIFAEVFACAGIKTSPVTVVSATESEVLFVNYEKIITTCNSACSFHTRLVENMLKLIANKNIMLNQKIELLSKRTTREKLLSYFAIQAFKAKSKSFLIPFSRQELADFLCVDRSAMSRELCLLRDDGSLIFKGKQIKLL